MVSYRCYMLAILLLIMPSVQADESGLDIVVSRSSIEHGKSLYLNLSSTHKQPSLSSIDFSALEKDFVMHNMGDVELDKNTQKQTLQIRLYPRHTGKTIIPSFGLENIKTKQFPVTITPAIDPKNGAPIHVDANVSSTDIYVRQAVNIRMSLHSRAKILALAVGEVTKPEMDISYLPVKRTRSDVSDTLTRHQTGWVLYPTTSGQHKIQLPPIKYIRDGVATHLFYPPRLRLNVKSLPTYIPSTMPVGKFGLVLSVSDRLLLVRNKLSYLSIRVNHTGRDEASLMASLTRQLKSDRNIRFYPLEKFDDEYRVPFSVKNMGLFSLPEVRLQYFNPQQGKIYTQQYSLEPFIVLGQWLVYLIELVLFAGLALLLFSLYKKLNRHYYIVRGYLQAVYKMQLADSAAACKEALMLIANAESWPGNLSLQKWQECWARKYPCVPAISEHIQQLQEELYGKKPLTDMETVRSGLLEPVYKRFPLLRPLVRIKFAQKALT